MRILLDHNVPAYVRLVVPEAVTAHFLGWHELSNGRLLVAAERDGFELLVTFDRGFLVDHDLSERNISVAVLSPVDQSKPAIVGAANALSQKISEIVPGQILLVSGKTGELESVEKI